MFIKQEERGTVLGICVTPTSFTGRSGTLDYRAVYSGRRAIDMLRLVRFDLLLVSLNLPDMLVWNFMRHVKTNWPQQKWALVGGPLSKDQEIAARMFNVSTLFDTPPTIDDVCQWRTFSDVVRSAKGELDPEIAAAAVEASRAANGTPFNRSKQPSTFEITRSSRGYGRGSTYAKKALSGAV
jgi:CheY-like chemotaxis protein